jgi:DegV family protein with EDD domain
VQEFIDFFQRIAKRCDSIVNVLVSSKISGTIDNARKAMENLPSLDIHLVDTLAGSMGAGHIVLAAARAAKEKASVESVIQAAENLKEKVNLLFMVDTLEYLHRGGRIGGAKRYLGTALRIKPLLEFKDGIIQPLEQVRTRKKAIARLLDVAGERLGGKKMGEATVVDIDCPDQGDALADKVRKRFSPRELFRSGVSPVVGTHVGPGALGLAFYADD